jgi:hypothetical protein
MPVRTFRGFDPRAFDPEAIAAMSDALKAALEEVEVSGHRAKAAETIARRIA